MGEDRYIGRYSRNKRSEIIWPKEVTLSEEELDEDSRDQYVLYVCSRMTVNISY
jgi:hypothetical protein